MASPEPPHVPVIPPPRFFFAVALAAALFFVCWSWLALPESASSTAEKAIPAFDWRCAQFWHDWTQTHQHPWGLMVYLTYVGGVAAASLIAIMGAIWQTAIGHRFLAAARIAVIIGCCILNTSTKHFFDRERPPEALRD